jgi:hypothetical protein
MQFEKSVFLRRVVDKLFKSNLAFCVVCVFNLQFEKSVFLKRVVHSQSICQRQLRFQIKKKTHFYVTYKQMKKKHVYKKLFILTTSGIFAFFLARQPQDVLLHRFPPVKPCANENFSYPLVILRLGTGMGHLRAAVRKIYGWA